MAKRVDDDRGLTLTKTVMGTASYMAPEQAAGKTREIGPAADVHALGAILYEALTGRPPFRAATRELTIVQVLCDEAVPPTHLRSEVPPELEMICLKCLEKEAGHRYGSAEDLAEDLRRFLNGEALPAKTPADAKRQPRWARHAGYEILEVAGCSVSGMVYKARQVGLNRLVTLKTISATAQCMPSNMARFRMEAEAAARLDHPNIVRIYDFGESDGQPYFSMEYLDGGTMADRFVGRTHPARQAAELLETLARAVHYAHQQQIVHADLRPFNVLLTAGGMPKITGFGLALLLVKDPTPTQTRAVPRGLSNYMAPEQTESRVSEVGPATDVHALGAMLYELLTGRPPFLADTVQETLEQIRTRAPAPPSELQADVPAELSAVCLRCLQKEPGRRYASAAALADEMRRFLASEPTPEFADTDHFELVPGYELLEELGRGGMGIVYKAPGQPRSSGRAQTIPRRASAVLGG